MAKDRLASGQASDAVLFVLVRCFVGFCRLSVSCCHCKPSDFRTRVGASAAFLCKNTVTLSESWSTARSHQLFLCRIPSRSSSVVAS